jgi:hypothetical protein
MPSLWACWVHRKPLLCFHLLLLGLQTQPRSIRIPMLNLQSSILVQASSHMRALGDAAATP